MDKGPASDSQSTAGPADPPGSPKGFVDEELICHILTLVTRHDMNNLQTCVVVVATVIADKRLPRVTDSCTAVDETLPSKFQRVESACSTEGIVLIDRGIIAFFDFESRCIVFFKDLLLY